MRNDKGFTLVEMVVAMAIFMGIMIIASYGFERVLGASGQQSRSVQSNFEGVVGLEMLRYDVEHAGYGLPWQFQNYVGPITFRNLGDTANQEVIADPNEPMNGMDSTTLNAVDSENVRAINAGTATKEVNGSSVEHAAGGPDYLVFRSTVSALDDAARKWGYINYSTNTVDNLSYLKRWGTPDDITSADRFVTIRSTFTTSGTQNKILLMDGADDFEVNLSGSALPAGSFFKPADKSEIVVAYGISSASSSALRMPYHRTDYYVSRPDDKMPQHCNAGTGILYKTMVDHATGGFPDAGYPLLDCIGDLQVEFEYDANDDGNLTYLSPAGLNLLTASEIRLHLKNVRIYILTHEGKQDRSYNYPSDSIQVGDPRRGSSGRTLSSSDMASLFTADWRKYRWKLYTMVIRPKNLGQ